MAGLYVNEISTTFAQTTNRGLPPENQRWRPALSRVNMLGAPVMRGSRGQSLVAADAAGPSGKAERFTQPTNSGVNWFKLQTPTRYLLLGGAFIDNNSGWVVGAGSTILQTSDGGETWHESRLPNAANVRFNSTSFVDARLGWAVGSGGAIYRTINGGRSWHPQISGVTGDLLDVKFMDAVEGWAVGAEGTVLYTNDGGLHWTSERSGTPHALERIFFADAYAWLAVGLAGRLLRMVARRRQACDGRYSPTLLYSLFIYNNSGFVVYLGPCRNNARSTPIGG